MANPVQIDESIQKLAGQYAKKWLVTPWEWQQARTELTEQTQDYARAHWQVASRTIVVREEALDTLSKSQQPETPHQPTAFDPWEIDPITFPRETRQIVTCGSCKGEKKVTCRACQGSSRVRCSECKGSGSVPAKRSGLKKCPRCKATGTRKCTDCKSGLVNCNTCASKGMVQRWLEVKETTEEHTYGEDKVPGGHPHYAWPAFGVVAHKPKEQPFEVVLVWEGLTDQDAPPEAAKWLETLRPKLDPRTMRVQKVTVQIVRLRMQQVHFQLAGKQGFIAIDPQQKLVLPQESDTKALGRRLMLIGGGSLATFFWANMLANSYAEQHSFFAHNGITPMLTLMVWLITALTVLLCALLALPKQAPLAQKRKPAAIGLAALLLLQMGALRLGQPSAAHAEAQLLSGNTDQAFEEIAAAIHTQRDHEAAKALFDRYHLEQVNKAQSYKSILPYARFTFHLPDSRTKSLERIRSLAETEISQAYTGKAYQKVESDFTSLPQEVTKASGKLQEMYVNSLSAQGETCIQRFDKPCINTYAEKLSQSGAEPAKLKAFYAKAAQRIDTEAKKVLITGKASFDTQEKACSQVKQLLEGVKSIPLAGTAANPATYTRQCEQWQAQKVAFLKAESERKARAAAYAKKQAEQAEERRAAQEAKELLRAEWPYGRLICNDGTLSPSCSCPGKRGCCSHHGGVAGCQRY